MVRYHRVVRYIEVWSCDDDTDWLLDAIFSGEDAEADAEKYLELVCGVPLSEEWTR